MLAAPTWEHAAKTIARSIEVRESQVIALPLGEAFADSPEGAQRMRETAHEVVPLIVEALQGTHPIPAR